MPYITIDLGLTKSFLLPCTNGYLLIDTGYAKDYSQFLKILQKENIKLEEIKYLFLTHHHDDHAGFAAKLKELLDIPIIVHQKSVPLLATGQNDLTEFYPLNKRIKFISKILSIFKKPAKYQPLKITDQDMVISGDNAEILPQIGLKAQIIETPGHTKESISLLCEDGNAFVGDLSMNCSPLLGNNYYPLCYNNLEENEASMLKVIKAGAQTIIPTHGQKYNVSKIKKILAQKEI